MRILATFAVAFSAGIFLAQYCLPVDWLPLLAVAAFVLASGRMILHGKVGRRVLLIGLGLCLAFGYDWLYIRQIQRPMEAAVGEMAELTMTVCDYAVSTNFGAKVTVETDVFPGKLVYYGDEMLLDLQPGQTVTDTVYLQSASRIRDDDVTTFTSKGVFLLAYQRGEAVYGVGSMESVRWWPIRLGQAMRNQIGQMTTGDTAAFLVAILTGDKSGLSVQVSNDLSEAGLYHILAVSGMHCGFLMAIVILLLGRHRRRLLAGVMCGLLGFYAVLTGGSPSVVRACIMLMFLLAAPLFRRSSDGPTALSAALMLILLANPFAAASISLQLSFGAMAGILWLTPKLYRMLLGNRKRGRGYQFVASGFSATMGALVFTVPVSAYYFGTLVLVSPLSNLLCLWAASIVFILGLIAVVLGFLWLPLGIAAAVLPRVLIEFILGVAHLLAKIPYHAVYFVNPYLKYWLGFAYLLFAVAYWMRSKERRKYVTATVLSVLTLVVTVILGAVEYNHPLDAVVLDVGQGQSVVLASEKQTALVDCGSANSWYDAGGIAADQLITMGERSLDYLILTHYDSDHINGVEGLLARMRVDTILVPPGRDENGLCEKVFELAQEHDVSIHTVKSEESISLGTALLTVFPPILEENGSDNENGLVVLAAVGEKELLITGDMDSTTERKFLKTYDLPDVEVLLAGHHGSKYSTSDDLLDAVSPERVCISVGSNSYGHPADETMRRLAQNGCGIYRTDLQGNIHVSFD